MFSKCCANVAKCYTYLCFSNSFEVNVFIHGLWAGNYIDTSISDQFFVQKPKNMQTHTHLAVLRN